MDREAVQRSRSRSGRGSKVERVTWNVDRQVVRRAISSGSRGQGAPCTFHARPCTSYVDVNANAPRSTISPPVPESGVRVRVRVPVAMGAQGALRRSGTTCAPRHYLKAQGSSLKSQGSRLFDSDCDSDCDPDTDVDADTGGACAGARDRGGAGSAVPVGADLRPTPVPRGSRLFDSDCDPDTDTDTDTDVDTDIGKAHPQPTARGGTTAAVAAAVAAASGALRAGVFAVLPASSALPRWSASGAPPARSILPRSPRPGSPERVFRWWAW